VIDYRKQQVRDYWNANVCDTKEHLVSGELKDAIAAPKYSRAYFEEIERRRVASQRFAQPMLYRGKRVLEVGVGSGVDFVQWARAGAEAYGIDLTTGGVTHTGRWLAEYGLPGSVSVGDAEHLDFPDGAFDTTYSWGVLHHTPDTLGAVRECVRVTKPGGEIKLMLYNKDSLLWLMASAFKMLTGKDVESPGTKAFTKRWAKRLGATLPVAVESVEARTCEGGLLLRYGRLVSGLLALVNRVAGDDDGFFMTIRLRKKRTA